MERIVSNYCVYCLPSAGSSAAMFFPWAKLAAQNFRIKGIEYPGHGTRISESLISQPLELIEDIANSVILDHQTHEQVILFGHSLGAGLLLHVAELLQTKSPKLPLALLVASGRGSFSTSTTRASTEQIANDTDLLSFLEKYEGIPESLLLNQDALNFFLPIIRNDIILNNALLELNQQPPTTRTPLLVCSGRSDKNVSQESLQGWKKYCDQWLGIDFFDGGHFYLNDSKNIKLILQSIKKHVAHAPTPI